MSSTPVDGTGPTGRARLGAGRASGRILLILFFSLVPQFPTRAAAGDSDPGGITTVTLEQAIRRALEHNHQLTAARHAESAATWAHRQAVSRLLPSISLDSRYTRLDEETVGRANAFGREITMFLPDSSGELQPFTIDIPQTVFRDGYETSITGQLLLLHPEIWNGISLAGASKSLAGAQSEAAILATLRQTLAAHVQLRETEALMRLQEQHVGQAERNTAQAERLLGVGRYAEADLLRWRVEEAQQRSRLADAERGVRIASIALENAMGLAARGTVRADSLLSGALRREIERVRAMMEEDWEAFASRPLEEITALHPDHRILGSTERLSALQHRQSLAAFLPSVSIAGTYGWQSNDTPELDGEKAWSLTAALSVPIFTSFSNYSGHKTAEKKMLQTRETVRDGRNQILARAEAARLAMRSGAAQLRFAEESMSLARRAFAIQENLFALGRLGNLEWIDANLTLRTAEENRTSSYHDLILAIADYHEATGNLPSLFEE